MVKISSIVRPVIANVPTLDAHATDMLIATAVDFTFFADGDNILAFDNVTQASNAVVFLNTGEQVCWTSPSRVSPGGPSVIEKTNTQCMSSINLDYSTPGNWN
jgi:hypothetical protein